MLVSMLVDWLFVFLDFSSVKYFMYLSVVFDKEALNPTLLISQQKCLSVLMSSSLLVFAKLANFLDSTDDVMTYLLLCYPCHPCCSNPSYIVHTEW